MPLRDRLYRHRKDHRWITGGLALLLLVLTAVYYLLQRGRDLPAALVTNRVLIFVLWYVNVVLILIILFVLARNIVKLVVERHHQILGSKFKTKLVATYIGLTLVPVLLLFAYASELLQGWIDRWFNTPAVKQVLEQGSAVAEAMNNRIADSNLRAARQVAEAIRPIELGASSQRTDLTRRLRRLLEQQDLDYVGVYENTDFVHGVVDSQAGIGDLPDPGRSFLRQALDVGEAIKGQPVRLEVPPGSEGRLILGAVAAPAAGRSPPRVVVTGTLLEPVLASQTDQLILAYQGYRQLEVQKGAIKASYLLTFLMVTLLILLASSWIGLLLARRVTVPIQALADGTRRISSGDLDHRVEAAADDELGVLVDSFNRMTAELKRNKELIEKSNRELVAANQHLAEERALIAAVLESVAAGVISVDAEGRILTCNGAALAMLRQREQEVVGRLAEEVWLDEERARLARLFAENAAGAGHLSREVRLVVGGEWKSFDVKVTTMWDAGGGLRGQVMVLEDLTELIKAQKLAAWSEAARRIAHEIKNPLTPIKLSAERLRRKWRQGDADFGATLDEGTALIVQEVEAMKGMVDEFSRFARMPTPHPTEVDLSKLVDDTLHLYDGLKPGVKVGGWVEPGARRAWVDAEQLKRALINLLDNAIEATEAPGRVEISAGRQDHSLEIHVTDTGRGIPSDLRDKLFLPHFSTKGRGTGLGLAIVHRIVSDHHGTIRVEDNRPRGTVFTIDLPLS